MDQYISLGKKSENTSFSTGFTSNNYVQSPSNPIQQYVNFKNVEDVAEEAAMNTDISQSYFSNIKGDSEEDNSKYNIGMQITQAYKITSVAEKEEEKQDNLESALSSNTEESNKEASLSFQVSELPETPKQHIKKNKDVQELNKALERLL